MLCLFVYMIFNFDFSFIYVFCTNAFEQGNLELLCYRNG